jgi:4-hydroxybutyrate dehydrogenase
LRGPSGELSRLTLPLRAAPAARSVLFPGPETVWQNSQRTRIHFIDSEIDEVLRIELEALSVERPLLVADQVGFGAEIFEELLFGGCGLAADEKDRMSTVYVAGSQGAVDSAASVARRLARKGHDSLIVIGGRGVIDAGKMALRDVIRRRGQHGRQPPAQDRVPLIVIPTGPEDGAGLRCWTRVRDASGSFKSLQDEAFTPDVLICDSRLGKEIGKEAAICAEFDVLVHCIETLVRPRLSPPAKGLALDCLRRTWRHLRYKAGHGGVAPPAIPRFARAVNAALSETGGLGAAHAIALCLEEAQPVAPHHGFFHAAVLGPVIRFNEPAIAAAIAEIEEILVCTGGAVGIAATVLETAMQFGLPGSLADLNLNDQKISQLAQSIAEDPGSMTNPRRAKKVDYEQMLREIS